MLLALVTFLTSNKISVKKLTVLSKSSYFCSSIKIKLETLIIFNFSSFMTPMFRTFKVLITNKGLSKKPAVLLDNLSTASYLLLQRLQVKIETCYCYFSDFFKFLIANLSVKNPAMLLNKFPKIH